MIKYVLLFAGIVCLFSACSNRRAVIEHAMELKEASQAHENDSITTADSIFLLLKYSDNVKNHVSAELEGSQQPEP